MFGFVFLDTSGPNHGQTSKTLWFLLNDICTDIHLLGSCEKDSSVGILYGKWGRIGNDDIKMTGQSQNMDPMCKKLMKNVDIHEPTSCLDHVYLECTQRECKPNKIIVDEYRKMLESRISAGATEKLPGWEKLHAKTVVWSSDMEGHAQKSVERCCELANKKTDYKFSWPC